MFSMLRNTKKTADKIASIEKDIEENKAKLIGLEQEMKGMDVDAKVVLDCYSKAQVC